MKATWAAFAASLASAVARAEAGLVSACPAECSDGGNGRDGSRSWTAMDNVARLADCQKPMLLDLGSAHEIDAQPDSHSELRACTLPPAAPLARRDDDAANVTLCNSEATATSVGLEVATAGDGSNLTWVTADALAQVGAYMSTSCSLQQTFSYGSGAIVGLFSGSAIDNGGTAEAVLAAAVAIANNSQTGSPESFFLQRCVRNASSPSSRNTFGVAVTNGGNFSWVRAAVQAWRAGECLETSTFPASLGEVNTTGYRPRVSVWEYSHPAATLANVTGPGNATARVSTAARSLATAAELLGKRAACTTATVASGDSCASLATTCGITAAQFTQYNDDPDLCSTLVPGERVCCSAGTLPDVTPKENSNGTCSVYTVARGDSCSSIGAVYDLTVKEIETFNNGTTWGWNGCNALQAGLSICLSKGSPPMPNAVESAECGPLVPGTEQPTNGTALADLNPCPLNACCDMWGQCGITPDYCTNHTGPAGNPGTAPAGENGCISNCGTDIVNNDQAPVDFIRVGYYESWNWDRPCLNMRASEIDTAQYTHVHWGFATIGDGFTVVINDTYGQWADFKALSARRIVSLGGWGYSTGASTYDQLRQAMKPANAATFAKNIIQFLEDEEIDGVDFDWEYPGAPDIPGIPAGLASDGPNYFTFLGTLRGHLGHGTNKTLSFAAPASFWYLKSFPIKKMAEEADYVVYMTYDLHGQWDYGNAYAQDGCPTGNCLRSHVNLTETLYALAMITKAGVPANRITVGVSSYGRSFGMADPSCTGPQCFFTGSNTSSTAALGVCTQTGGYIANAELLDYVYANTSGRSWYDSTTDSNYLLYNGSSWAAYMTDEVKASRRARYQDLHFAGTVDWAVDLADWGSYDGEPSGTGNCTGTDADVDNPDCPDDPSDESVVVCDADVASLDDLSDADMAAWPDDCAGQYLLQALGVLLADAQQNLTALLRDGYDDKFQVYAKAVADSARTQVHDFVLAHGSAYFTCTVTELRMCCDACRGEKALSDSYCDYCFDGTCYTHAKRGDYNPLNNRKLITSYANETEPCPPDYSARGYGPDDPYEQTVYWTLVSSKADDFYADLLNATGIPKDKIGFGLYTDSDTCGGTGHTPGDGAACWNTGYEFGAPVPRGYSAADVTNPKDLAQKGLNNSADLPGQIGDAVARLAGLAYLGNDLDLVDAVSLPIMMIVQGVESMSVVVQTADKIEEEERKALILAFISAILFFVPIAGEVVGAVADIADIVAVIDVLGAAGNAAMDIYTLVDDPANAPLAIVDLIMAPLALADVAVVAKAAKIQRGMSADDLAKLGTRVGERMSKVTSVTGKCFA